jgi:hypothetical protein
MPFGEKEPLPDYDGAEIKGKRYITFTDIPEFGYVDCAEKAVGLKLPIKSHTLRPKAQMGRRFIREGVYGRNTDLEIDIYKNEKTRFINITEEFAKADLATDNPPVTGSYKHDLYNVLKTFYPKYFPAELYILYFRPVIKERQSTLENKIIRKF